MCLWLHVRSLNSPGDEAKYVLSIFWCWSVWWMVVDTSEEKILLISLFYFRLIQKTQQAIKMTQFGQILGFLWAGLLLSCLLSFAAKFLVECHLPNWCPPSAVCPFKHRFRLFTPHDLWHSSIGIGAKSFGWLVWRRNLSSSTIGTPGALRQANLWSFMCLSKSCCFSWQNSFWNSKGWTASIFALRRKTIDLPYQKPHVFKGLKAKAYFLHFYGLEWECNFRNFPPFENFFVKSIYSINL